MPPSMMIAPPADDVDVVTVFELNVQAVIVVVDEELYRAPPDVVTVFNVNVQDVIVAVDKEIIIAPPTPDT